MRPVHEVVFHRAPQRRQARTEGPISQNNQRRNIVTIHVAPIVRRSVTIGFFSLLLSALVATFAVSAADDSPEQSESIGSNRTYNAADDQDARLLAEEIWLASDEGRSKEVNLAIGSNDGEESLSLEATSTFDPGDPDDLVDEQLTVYRGATDRVIATVAVSPTGVVLSVDGPGDHNHRLVVPVEGIRSGEDPGKSELDPGSDLSSDFPDEPEFRGMLRATSLNGEELREATGAGEDDISEDMKGLYSSPPGGNSIYLSKHLWKRGSWCGPSCGAREPINVIFYNYAYANRMGTIHTDIRGGRKSCGSSSQAYFGDGRHGGANQWQTQNAHYAWADQAANYCPVTGPRMHLRSYTSRSGDNHWPGFRYYTVGGVHHENWAHGNVNPQKGQDYMFFRWPQHPWVSNGGTTIVPNSSSECASCHNWGGFVDFYNVTTGSTDSCEGKKNYRFNSSGQGVTWTCS